MMMNITSNVNLISGQEYNHKCKPYFRTEGVLYIINMVESFLELQISQTMFVLLEVLGGGNC